MNLDRSRSLQGTDRLARGIGWLGIGIGIFQLLSPRSVTRSLGVEGSEGLVRTCGTRGLVTGIGALTEDPKPALWAKAAGDVLDLAALSFLLTDRDHPKQGSVKLAMGLVGASALATLYCARAQTERHSYQGGRTPDYSGRSGFPRGVERARGAAAGSGLSLRPAALPSPARSPGPRIPASTSRPTSTNYIRGSDYDY
ncbi:hypothetical protein HNO52_01540 [Billgrantia diversa]|uniref:hypothetical protein n=1 Tax=Halomonas sp. MCCC 1A13316 TaxID=2733487 RepID=UPI0018A5A7A8|nr:hypothetical protein [Halomonas sp. MCCC 1A13316]QOR37337.1 hypothetical protein HNO52_01540 [Halomonas sp. MCCC 1A13316]